VPLLYYIIMSPNRLFRR